MLPRAKQKKCLRPNFFLHIPSNWVKIGWHTKNQHPHEMGERREKEMKTEKICVNNGLLMLAKKFVT